MKLKAFRIRNFRSIVDSGWNYLAYDNITALIGQNESGKTSVLEALYSFYNGKISDDILRSDMTFPIVNCTFILEGEKLADLFNSAEIPEPIREKFLGKEELTLIREWKADRSSIISIGDEDILEYYLKKEEEKRSFELVVQNEITELINRADTIISEMQLAEQEQLDARNEMNHWQLQLENVKRTLKKARNADTRSNLENEYDTIQKTYIQKEQQFAAKQKKFEEKKQLTQEISEKVTVAKKCLDAIENTRTALNDLDYLGKQLKEAEHIYEIFTNEKEKKNALQKLEKLHGEYHRIRKIYSECQEKEILQKLLTDKVFKGQNYKAAEAEALTEIQNDKKILSPEDFGTILLKYIPVFDFFEDFSSLLPNKIDLEDILLENEHTEGFKAVKNFLVIAGLTSDFFREKNHRILKQKIENLNGEITIDFQDYWRQNVGKDNKIRLNFELEHYDYTEPEKSGKPYLEFWIKDRQERLYPKQRSRGVRWFLSFYLELKATSIQNSVKRILLIDEPGLSLHARAQEDVLKVFEDLKGSMQIVYCTHSPHLVDVNKLYRVLAVQRADENDENSESVILDSKSLPEASTDTLSPIYSLMGAKVNEQQFIQQKNNIIVQDTVTYFFLQAMSEIFNLNKSVHFIPASGINGIQTLANILTGWRLDFYILLFGNGELKKAAEDIRNSHFLSDPKSADKKIKVFDDIASVENLFSTIDFKRYILQKRVGITESNSDYIITNELSRTLLASGFISHIKEHNISFEDFDEDTRRNFSELFNAIQSMIE
ncbi:MAG: AAA family ATPase [Bacteroidales bacterium]|nr:AAA family ATPase [Bacteroidales bacterium]